MRAGSINKGSPTRFILQVLRGEEALKRGDQLNDLKLRLPLVKHTRDTRIVVS
jgi:hypothetical protein